MHHEQDMRNYGGLRKKIPYTFWAMMIGTLAITGVGIPLTHIGFAGFLSKDAVIESAWAGTQGGYGFWMLVVAALFTSFYSWRLMFMTFYGEARGDKHTHDHAHESPSVMLVPLGCLALGACSAAWSGTVAFFGDHAQVNRFFGMAEPHIEAMVPVMVNTAATAKTNRHRYSSGDAQTALESADGSCLWPSTTRAHYFRPQTIM